MYGIGRPNSDGMSVVLTLEDRKGAKHVVTLPLVPKPANFANPAWEAHWVSLLPGLEGHGRLTVAATSPSGDSTADWAYLRRLALVAPAASGAGR